MISPRVTWTEADYFNRRYHFLKLVEESGRFSLNPYIDLKGFPTIGIGFKIKDNIDAILIGMGIPRPQDSSMAKYRARIISEVTPGKHSSSTSLQAALDNVMFDIAADPAVASSKRTTFSFASETEIKSVFGSISPTYNTAATAYQRKHPKSFLKLTELQRCSDISLPRF